MIKYFTLCMLIVCSCKTFAQDTQSIIGKWQAVVMTDNNMYYDIEKDSFVIDKDYLRTAIMDSAKLAASLRDDKAAIRNLVLQNRLYFKPGGSYTSWFGLGAGSHVSGQYKLEEARKIITFLQETQEKVKDQMRYQFYDNRLEIKLTNIERSTSATPASPENELTIVYKKVNQF